MKTLRRPIALVFVGVSWVGLGLACGDDADNAPNPAVDGGDVDASDSGGASPVDGASDAKVPSEPTPSSRPTALACERSSPRPASNASPDAGPDASIECTLDTECIAKADGRCNELRALVWFGSASLGTRCTYDMCTTDDQCSRGVCGCALGFAGQNVCLTEGNCRIDAECSPGQVCSFSQPLVLKAPGVIVTGNEEGVGVNQPREALGWFCTTSADECTPGQMRDGAPSDGCVYGADVGHWIWWYQP